MKVSSLIVGIIVVGLFSTVFGLYFSNISTQYNQDYNETAFDGYNNIAAVNNQTQSIREGIDEDSTQEGITDLIGGFLKRGFAVLKITFQSFGLINDMGSSAINQLDDQTGGANLNIFSVAIIAIIAVIFLFLIISVLVGRDI